MTSYLIDNRDAVDDACGRLAREPAIGVDTEFMRVRTYYPKLALVQVAASETIYCFDPLAEGLDLDRFWSILADPGVLKVIHSARQDIEVLLHTAGIMPTPLFDTQVAAGLLGYPEQSGYAALVEAEFGKALPKGAQRTDWTRRPLSASQLGYAENDVRYLLPLHERLRSRLRDLGRLEWAEEDFRRVLDPGLYDPDPAVAYRRVGRGAHLKRRAQHHLRNLCAWREQAARRRDLPRHWVVDDEAIAAIAEAGPRSVAELERVSGIRGDVVRRDGRAIIECLEAQEPAAGLLWPRPQPLTPEQKSTKAAMVEAVKKRAGELGLVESVLVTRADLDRLVRGAVLEEVIRGWRRREIGGPLERILEAAGEPQRSSPA